MTIPSLTLAATLYGLGLLSMTCGALALRAAPVLDDEPPVPAATALATQIGLHQAHTDAARVVNYRHLGRMSLGGVAVRHLVVRPWDAYVAPIIDIAVHLPIISQKGKIFSPPEVNEPLGATVRIDNDDDVLHNLLLTDPEGNTRNLGTKRPGEYTDIMVDKRGEYLARCGIHPRMKLTISVR